MQLKKIKGQMAIATCALLQVGSPTVNAAETDWDVDTSFLIYSESDGRVSAFEPAVRAEIALAEDEYFNVQVVVDALTGATPNGAHKSTVVQTFTNPSGNGSYTVQPGELPLSQTFKDTRLALTAEWDKPVNRESSVLMGATLSHEIDYTSLGVSATYKHDLNNKNTTLTAGIATTADVIMPIGKIPVGLNPMRSGGSDQQRAGADDTKNSLDLIVGVTQVLSRKTLLQLNYTHGTSSGYHNDYNNVVTVLDPGTNEPLVGGWLGVDDLPYLFEKRPDSRSKNILFVKGVHHLTEDVINLSYRYYSDDWGIKSHTLDLKYRYQLSDSYLQPHVRYYTQSAADFYTHDLVQGVDVDGAGNVLVDYASNDYRLAESETITMGLKYGMPMGDDSEISIRGEMITQTVTDGTALAGQETPDLNAIVLQVNYSFVW